MVKRFFSFLVAETPALPDPGERVRLATCVLLLEVAHADDEFTVEERRHLLSTIGDRFGLNVSEAEELVETADAIRNGSIDLWQFTHALNTHCGIAEKTQIMEEVWRMICADGMLDAHEEHFVRRLGKLLNLTHAEVIEAKLKVFDAYRNR